MDEVGHPLEANLDIYVLFVEDVDSRLDEIHNERIKQDKENE